MAAYRNAELNRQSIRKSNAPLKKAQADALLFAARLIRDGKATAEDALGIVLQVFEEV